MKNIKLLMLLFSFFIISSDVIYCSVKKAKKDIEFVNKKISDASKLLLTVDFAPIIAQPHADRKDLVSTIDAGFANLNTALVAYCPQSQEPLQLTKNISIISNHLNTQLQSLENSIRQDLNPELFSLYVYVVGKWSSSKRQLEEAKLLSEKSSPNYYKIRRELNELVKKKAAK